MKRSFTLIELLIVVVIIGILAAIAIPTFRGDYKKQQRCIENLNAIFGAIERYRDEHGSYPPDGTGGTDNLKTALSGYLSASVFVCPSDTPGSTDSYSSFYVKRNDYSTMDSFSLGCHRHKDSKLAMNLFFQGQTIGKDIAPVRDGSGSTIEPGDILPAGEAVFLDGSSATVNSGNTQLVQSFKIGGGKCYSILKAPSVTDVFPISVTSGSRFEIVTPAGIAGVGGTDLGVEVTHTGGVYTMNVDVGSGIVRVTTDEDAKDVREGQAASCDTSNRRIRLGNSQRDWPVIHQHGKRASAGERGQGGGRGDEEGEGDKDGMRNK